jgi:hypothetical protein
MNLATSLYSAETDPWPERCFDLLRGASVLTGNDLLLRLARTVSRHPEAQLDVAFNHRQIASKLWARDELAKLEPGRIGLAWIVGGWYAVLAALLLEDPRLDLGRIVSFDIDPGVATVARSLNEPQVVAGRFDALTADMYQLARCQVELQYPIISSTFMGSSLCCCRTGLGMAICFSF